jgi:hypothetical protein
MLYLSLRGRGRGQGFTGRPRLTSRIIFPRKEALEFFWEKRDLSVPCS